MSFKRGRPKNRRAGCLMCKPWKMNGAKTFEVRRGDEQVCLLSRCAVHYPKG